MVIAANYILVIVTNYILVIVTSYILVSVTNHILKMATTCIVSLHVREHIIVEYELYQLISVPDIVSNGNVAELRLQVVVVAQQDLPH